MHLRTKTSAVLSALAVAGGAAAAVALGPAGQAVGQVSQPTQVAIQVDSPATLVAKGAGVDVPVTIECSHARSANIQVSLTERVGSYIASGYGGGTTVVCTDQTIQVTVTASSLKAFKKGSAIANAYVFACYYGCAQEQVTSTITIK